MSTDKIPFLDLVTPHREIEEDLIAVCREAFRTARFIGGPNLTGFEEDFAAFCETEHCAGVASGTDALRFAFTAAGIGPDQMVITVSHTFIATTEALSQVGASIRFVDIDENSFTMDPVLLAAYLEKDCRAGGPGGRPVDKATGKTVTAIVPVHLYGQCADMYSIMEIARKYNLIVIEDACQAHGARCYSQGDKKWHAAGSMGHAAAFSFYPGKNLGACGEGGAVTTNDKNIADTVKMLRDHGQARKYMHAIEGYNGRLDAIQAGLLRIKLKKLPEWNEGRRRAAKEYNEALAGIPSVTTPAEPEWSQGVYHLYVVRLPDRDGMMRKLADNNIGSGLHYPIPLHRQKAYECMNLHEGALPVTERVAREILSLPMFPTLTGEQIQRVAEVVKEE